jgi:hypothetical protein
MSSPTAYRSINLRAVSDYLRSAPTPKQVEEATAIWNALMREYCSALRESTVFRVTTRRRDTRYEADLKQAMLFATFRPIFKIIFRSFVLMHYGTCEVVSVCFLFNQRGEVKGFILTKGKHHD